MTGKASVYRVNAIQRQFMQCLRAGHWVLVSKLPVPVGERTVDRIVQNSWIERRGVGPGSEIKLTPAGLVALQARI